MSTVLPEHTVDTWLAWYLLHRFNTALLWAPTQRDVKRRPWDVGATLGPGRVFIFEAKASSHGPTRNGPQGNRVVIDVDQLRRYGNDSWYLQDALFYVLPFPPFADSESGSPIPIHAAARQSDRRLPPCYDWMLIASVRTLCRQLEFHQKTIGLSEETCVIGTRRGLFQFCDGIDQRTIGEVVIDDSIASNLDDAQGAPDRMSGGLATLSALHIPAGASPSR